MKTKILIGTGVLNWNRSERISDRYGAITMNNDNADDVVLTKDAKLFVDEIRKHRNEFGYLVCHILETRESTHLGDLFHGFFPSTPKKGANIKLGEGKLFYEYNNIDTVGLRPIDDRETFWLDPKKLYQVHEQTVELYFISKTKKL
jgi:hypothetical protein